MGGGGLRPIVGVKAEGVGASVLDLQRAEEDRHEPHALLDARDILPNPLLLDKGQRPGSP